MLWRIVLVAIAFGCAWSALHAAQAASDYHQLHRIAGTLVQWENARRIDDDRQLARHVAQLEQLVDRYPRDPQLRLTLAKLYEWRAHLQRYNTRAANASWAKAESHLREAVRLRPLSGKAWAAWLDASSRFTDQWPEELQHRLETALRLGRHDLHTQQYLQPLVLREWNNLPAEIQTTMQNFLRDTHRQAGQSRSNLEKLLRERPDHPLAGLVNP